MKKNENFHPKNISGNIESVDAQNDKFPLKNKFRNIAQKVFKKSHIFQKSPKSRYQGISSIPFFLDIFGRNLPFWNHDIFCHFWQKIFGHFWQKAVRGGVCWMAVRHFQCIFAWFRHDLTLGALISDPRFSKFSTAALFSSGVPVNLMQENPLVIQISKTREGFLQGYPLMGV